MDDNFMQKILAYLEVEQAPPSLHGLDALLNAYVRHVPWESASRIAKRAMTTQTASCPRWPEAFWQDAMSKHTGGTCFESNYAFYKLLHHLGYTAYLTINNMNDSIGCHTALVVTLDHQRYLVDVGLPVHLPLPLDSNHRTERVTDFHTYSATPLEPGVFIIERDRHPRPYCFTLIDRPVAEVDYRQALTNDYGETGLFLDRVILVKVVNEAIHRFHAEGAPYQIERFSYEAKTYYYVGDNPAEAAPKIAAKFDMDAGVLAAALNLYP